MSLKLIRLLCGAFLFYCAGVQAEEPPVEDDFADTANAAEDQDEADPGYRVLLRETTVNVGDSGLRTTRVRTRILVEKAKAVEEVGDVNVPYNAYREEPRVVEAFTRGPDGKVTTLDRSAIHDKVPEDVAGFPMYTDARTISFAMPAVRPGALIDYDVEIREKTPIMRNEFFTTHYFDASVAVATSRFVMTFPKSRVVTMSQQAMPLATAADTTNGSKRMLSWELRDVRPVRFEAGMPALSEVRPCVRLTSVRSWEDVARWYRKLLDQPMREDAAVTALARKLTAGMTNDLDKTRALYRHVSRDVRYVGLELGRSAYEPHPTGETLKNRYGDCKDKAVLLTAMLQAVGVTAKVALVKPNYYGRVVQEQPSPTEFNHAVVYVPQGAGGWWIDATLPLADVLEHGANLDGVDALLPDVPEAAPVFIRIPVLDETHSVHRQTFEVEVGIGGFCRVSESDEYSGRAAIDERDSHDKLGVDKYRERMERSCGEWEGYSRLLDAVFSDATDETRPFTATSRYETDRYMAQTASGLSLDVDAANALDWIALPREMGGNTRQKVRVHPWVSRSAHTEEVVYRLHLADGLRLSRQPVPARREFKHGSIDLTFQDGAAPALRLRVVRAPARIEPGELAAASADVERALARMQAAIEIEDGIADLLAENNFVAAEKQLLEAAARKPSADAQLRLAQFYAETGRGWRGARAAEQAIALSPADHRGYAQLALSHSGVFGAPGKGFDREAINAIWDRALTNLPLRSWVIEQRALYAFFDNQGVRGTTNAPLKQAEELFRSCLKGKSRNFPALNGLGDVCRFQERYDEAEKYYRKALRIKPSAVAPSSGIWLSHAYDGRENDAYEAISAYCGRGSQDALSEAGRVSTLLLRDRRYAAAAALYERIINEVPRPDLVRPYLLFLQKLAKAPRVDYDTFFDDSSMEGAARTAFAAITRHDTNRLHRIMSTELADQMRTTGLNSLWASAGPEDPATALLGLDFLFSTFETHTRDLAGGDVAVVLEPPRAFASFKSATIPPVHLQVTHAPAGWRLIAVGEPRIDAMVFARCASRSLQQERAPDALAWQSRLSELVDSPSSPLPSSSPLWRLSDIAFSNSLSRVKAWVGAAYLTCGQTGEWPQGLKWLLEAASENPENSRLAANACLALAMCDHVAEAVKRAQALDPAKLTDANLLAVLCGALGDMGRYDLAARFLSRLKEVEPNSAFTCHAESMLLLHTGKPDEAQARVRTFAAQSARARQTAMFTMITLSLYLQDQKTMRDLAEESRQPGPPARLRCALADALREAQLFPEAREQISLAMTEAGAAPSAMLSAASIAQDDGCTPEALDYLRRAMILGLPGDELSLAFDHGSLLAALGRHEEAARVWLAIPGARNALGYAYHHVMAATELLHAGKKDEARALFNTVLAMDGELAWPKLIARLFLGQAGEADLQAWVNQTVSPFSKADRTCEFQYFMGTAHELAGKTDAATAAYRACLATRASQNVEFGLARAAQRRLNMPGK